MQSQQPSTLLYRKKTCNFHYTTSFKCRKLKHFETAFYSNRLLEIDWEPIYDFSDPNDAWNFFYRNIITILDKYYPIVEYKHVKIRSPWINSELYELMKEKEEAYKTAKLTKSSEDWAKAHKLRNLVNQQCKNAKDQYTLDNLENNKFNPKIFWSNLNSLWGSDKTGSQSDIILNDPYTNTETRKDESCSTFNTCFSKIASKIQQDIPTLSDNEKTRLNHIAKPNNTAPPPFPFRFNDIPTDTLKQIISGIDNYKSSGLPEITSKLFKITIKILMPIFRHILNLSLRTSIIPDDWKNSVNTPLHKAGNTKDPNNYRPIACIPLPGKILEKCIFAQFYSFIELNHLITDAQYGFRNNCGTQLAVAKLLDDICENINNDNSCLLTYTDLKKAFDTVHHDKVIFKLETNYFLSSSGTSLFRKYLTNRHQKVIVNNKLSSSLLMTTGVPQGSCLGPLLFLAYINDITTVIHNSSVLLFADDTILFHCVESFSDSHALMQLDLDNLNIRCGENLLQVNGK